MTKPHPPVWIGGWGDSHAEASGTLADNWLPGPTADLRRLLNASDSFWRTARWPAHESHPGVATDTRSHHRRHRSAGTHLAEQTHHGRLPQRVPRRLAPSVHRRVDRDGISTSSWRIASSSAARAVRGEDPPLRRAVRMTHLICRTFFPGMPHRHIMRELDLLAREIAPAFR